MMARTGSGWQYVLADLSLILFMVTAAALSQSETAPAAPREPSPLAEPLAVWKAGAGSPGLGESLAAQAPDHRAQLTILAPYAPGAQGNVATEAVVAMLHDQGFETGIDTQALAAMSRCARILRRPE